MSHVTAILSMLHEGSDQHSASRLFRAKPVLDWTLRRITRCENIDTLAILCWEDQQALVEPISGRHSAHMLVKGPRVTIPQVESVSAARRWADGWRGGLLGTCDFDLGFFAPWIKEIVQRLAADAALLVDPSSGLIDPVLLDELIDHAQSHKEHELCFSQAAPGLSGVLIRSQLIDRLVEGKVHPGKLLQYRPDQPARDPIGAEAMASVPTPVARSTDRFKLDSDRQIARLDRATHSLNGTLIVTEAEEIVGRMRSLPVIDPLPREVIVELTTRRLTKPVFSPLIRQSIDRPDMGIETGTQLVSQLASTDDLRLTFSGVGDPLLADNFQSIILAARDAGIRAIHVETDLLDLPGSSMESLAACGADVISVHIPGANSNTYRAVMGYDGMAKLLENLRKLTDSIDRFGLGTPLVVPIFTKCQINLSEMEACYDHWLRTMGHCVIAGPTTFGGLIDDAGVADMTPPMRRACTRLKQRLTILSDGRVVLCEQDVLGEHPLGQIGSEPISRIWQTQMASMRDAHNAGKWNELGLCGRCREWHRP